MKTPRVTKYAVVSCQFHLVTCKTRAPHKKGSISTAVNTTSANRKEMPRHKSGPNLLVSCDEDGACDTISQRVVLHTQRNPPHAARCTDTRPFFWGGEEEGGGLVLPSRLAGSSAQRKTQARVRALQSGWSRRLVAMDASASWRRSQSGKCVGCNISSTMAASAAGRATSVRRTTRSCSGGSSIPNTSSSSSPVKSITVWLFV